MKSKLFCSEEFANLGFGEVFVGGVGVAQVGGLWRKRFGNYARDITYICLCYI